jgi:hypothetical protein
MANLPPDSPSGQPRCVLCGELGLELLRLTRNRGAWLCPNCYTNGYAPQWQRAGRYWHDHAERVTQQVRAAWGAAADAPLLEPSIKAEITMRLLAEVAAAGLGPRPVRARVAAPACSPRCRSDCSFLSDLYDALRRWNASTTRRTPKRADIAKRLLGDRSHFYERLRQHGITDQNWPPPLPAD